MDLPPICGTALREMDRIRAGDGNPLAGDLVLAQRALEALEARAEPAPTPLELAEALVAVCRALGNLSREAEARPHLERALALLADAPDSTGLAYALADAASFAPDRAADLYGRALAVADRAGGIDRSWREIWRKSHAAALLDARRFEEAVACYREALRIDRTVERSPTLVYTGGIQLQRELARALVECGRHAEADAELEGALVEARRIRGAESSEAMEILMLRGDLREQTGDVEGARAARTEALAIARSWVTYLEGQGPSGAASAARYARLARELESALGRGPAVPSRGAP